MKQVSEVKYVCVSCLATHFDKIEGHVRCPFCDNSQWIKAGITRKTVKKPIYSKMCSVLRDKGLSAAQAEDFLWELGKFCLYESYKKPKTSATVRNNGWEYLGFTSYEKYLASPLWKEIRKRVLNRDGHRCRLCGKPANQVHHQSYSLDTFSGQRIDTLFSVCRKCHLSVEFGKGRKKRVFSQVVKRFKTRLEQRERRLATKPKKGS